MLGSSPRWGSAMSLGQCGHREVPRKGSVGERTQGRAPASFDNVARYLITNQRLPTRPTHAMFPSTSPGGCESFFFFLRGIFMYECFAHMHVCMYTICILGAHGG